MLGGLGSSSGSPVFWSGRPLPRTSGYPVLATLPREQLREGSPLSQSENPEDPYFRRSPYAGSPSEMGPGKKVDLPEQNLPRADRTPKDPVQRRNDLQRARIRALTHRGEDPARRGHHKDIRATVQTPTPEHRRARRRPQSS